MFLDGIRILDLSSFLPGPYASMLLADLGAEVIKIEQPSGDSARRMMPDMFNMVNRNKKSMTLNLKHSQGLKIFSRLATEADVIIEGSRPGVANKLNVDYESMRELNPKIIYCSISGFGQDGPYRNRPGHDINYLGYAGLLSLPGDLEYPPVRSALPIADLASALFATISILAALQGRNKTGQGTYIDTSLTESSLSLLSVRLGDLLAFGKITAPEEMPHLTPLNNIYETKDGKKLSIGAMEDHFWQKLCQVLGRQEWLKDSRFATHPLRSKNYREILPGLKQAFLTKDREEWLNLLNENDVPCAPVYLPQEVENDPQIRFREMIREVVGPKGKMKQVAFPAKFSAQPIMTMTAPPALGEHTDSLLSELGFSPEELSSLRQQGVI